MPKIDSLKKRAAFLAAAASGKKWAAPGLILQINMSQKTGAPLAVRYGLTASGKIGNAIVRNKARRRLRSLAHDVLSVHAMPGDYVLIARVTTIKRDFADLRQDLITALRKLKVWKDE